MGAEAAEDIGFTFDPRSFLAGLDKIGGGLSKIESATKKAGDKMGGAMTWALLKAQALGSAIKGAIHSIGDNIPEIGQTFKMASDIFLKNFLWPLRQALGPYLQKLLDWVRDNRVQFVQWGTIVANVFRVAVVLAKSLWDILSGLWNKVLKPIIDSIFGSSGIGGGITLLLGKLAILATYLTGMFDQIFKSSLFKAILADISAIAKNVWDFVAGLFKANEQGNSMGTLFQAMGSALANGFKVILDVIKALTDGVMRSSLTQIMTPLTNVAKSIEALMKTIGDFTGSEGGQGFFSWIGQNFGNAVMLTITTITTGIMLLVDALQWLIYVIRGVTALSTGKMFDWTKEASILATQQGEGLKSQAQSYVSTFTNMGSAMGMGPPIDVGGVNVSISTAEGMAGMTDADAKAAASKSGQTVEQVILNAIRKKRSMSGLSAMATGR